ncbi:MAG: hypothetical protein HY791_06820 [Deltaproteobacteria bacterium]|nr:hypothetical protein [Deltaproteobacteria bacterium]
MTPTPSSLTFERAFELLIQPGVLVLRKVAKAPNRWLELNDDARARSLQAFALSLCLVALSVVMGHWRGVSVGALAFVIACCGIGSDRAWLIRWTLRLALVVAAVGLWDWCLPQGGHHGFSRCYAIK